MKSTYLQKVDGKQKISTSGSKASGLWALQHKGFRTPQTYVVQWQAFADYRSGNLEMVSALQAELTREINPEKTYAVRSSANLEDSLEHSFAGQFKSVLNVRGIENLFQSIWSVWATADSPIVRSYLEKNGKEIEDVKMGVIIQEMVSPVLSGVAFSKNPMTGLDEIVIEAVHGDGSALVQEGCTPLRWVYRWGKWAAVPAQEETDLSLILRVVEGTQAVAKAFRRNVDLEWVFDGNEVYWVQMREITTLQNMPVYSNKMAREMLPGVIKPLIWSINIPLVNGAWINILSELIGKNDLTPEKLAKAFHYRAYFDMAALGKVFNRLGLPQESLEMMMGIDSEENQMPSFKPNAKVMVLIPRLLAFMVDKMRFSGKIRRALPRIERTYQRYRSEEIEGLDEITLLRKIDELFKLSQGVAYYNIVGPLLMMFYSGMLQKQLKKVGIDYKDFDLLINAEEMVRYDPNPHLTELHRMFAVLPPALQAKVLTVGFAEIHKLKGMDDFKKQVDRFMDHFGHLSDSGNDFSKTTWRETPELVLSLIANHARAEKKLGDLISYEKVPFRGFHRWVVSHIYRQTREFMLYREHISFVYTYGYGLFRDYFLRLADLLVVRGILEAPADIFDLYYDEIKEIVGSPQTTVDYPALIAQRKQEMEKSREYYLPPIIYGDQVPPLYAGDLRRLIGFSTSGGYSTGKVKVIHGIGDFQKLEKGDILVVPFTDVSWTPLFASAGAVVSESGGMLSHSSIIAREYKIPAVVSVEGATLLKDNTWVTVDGYKGEVVVHDAPLG